MPADPHHGDECGHWWHVATGMGHCSRCGQTWKGRNRRDPATSAPSAPPGAPQPADGGGGHQTGQNEPHTSDTPGGAHGHQADTIRARLEAATPGPWKWQRQGDPRHGPLEMTAPSAPNPYRPANADECATVLYAYNDHCCEFQIDVLVEDADAEFIAHAPTDVAWLLAELARVREAGDQLAAAVQPLLDDDVKHFMSAWELDPMGDKDGEQLADDLRQALAAWKDAQPEQERP